MRLLISYLKEKLPVIGVYAVMLVIFCILLWLKEVPFDVIGYGAELSAIWLLFVGALNFWFYRKRYQSLLDLSAALPHELKEFPDPKSRIEAEYQEITETIFAWREMLENEVLLSKKDASDYYSLWVHQIKTPISAMHLLIQSFEEQAMEFEEHAEETLNFLNEMKMKIFQTEEYVGMVLSYLRMEDMGNDLKFQWYPIGDIVRQAVRKYSQIFILKKIHLNFQDSRQMVLTDENEQKAIEDLGAPEEAASALILDLAQENAVKPPKTMKRRFSALWIAILALFAAPIALPLALGILAVIGAVILGILAVVGGILISALAAIAGSVLGIIGGIAIIPQTFGGGLVTIGLSLMLIGCGILVTYFTILLARWIIIKLAGLLGKLVRKGGKRHEEK